MTQKARSAMMTIEPGDTCSSIPPETALDRMNRCRMMLYTWSFLTAEENQKVLAKICEWSNPNIKVKP